MPSFTLSWAGHFCRRSLLGGTIIPPARPALQPGGVSAAFWGVFRVGGARPPSPAYPAVLPVR